jgi:zinc protease
MGNKRSSDIVVILPVERMENVKKTRFRFGWIIILLVTVFTGTGWSREKPTDKIVVPEVKYSHFNLKNGLKIYVFEDHQVPLVEVNLWYKVGSLDEPEGITGISHMLEHTMFLGTDTLPKDRIHQLVKEVGGYSNAYTNNESTRYFEKLPTANLELAIAIEADRMGNLKIDPEEFRREKEVVKQERRRSRENDAISSALEEIKAAAFATSPLHHEVIGWMSDIDGLTAEKLREYYGRYYGPNNAILAVAGDVTPDRVFKLAEQYFGDYPSIPITRNIAVEPEQKEERKLVIKKLTNVPYIFTLYKLPEGNHPDMVAINFLLEILAGRSNSRVNLELKQKKELILGSAAWATELPVPGYALIVLVPVAEDKIEAVETGFDAELNRLIIHGVADEELRVIKKAVIKDLVFSRRNITSLASKIIVGEVRYNDPEFFKKEITYLNELTKEDIVRVAKQYFIKEHRTVGYVVPLQSDSCKTDKPRELN